MFRYKHHRHRILITSLVSSTSFSNAKYFSQERKTDAFSLLGRRYRSKYDIDKSLGETKILSFQRSNYLLLLLLCIWCCCAGVRGNNYLPFASTWVNPHFFLVGPCYSSFFSFMCCVVFLCFVCLRLVSQVVCPMLPVSLDFPFLIAHSVFSNVYILLFCLFFFYNCDKPAECFVLLLLDILLPITV